MRRYTTYSGKRWENETEEAYIMAETMKVYTIEELESLLNVTKRTLYSYIKEGKLQAVKMGKYWRVREDQLGDFLSSDTGRRFRYTPEEAAEERELIEKVSKLSPEGKSLLLRILTLDNGKEDVAAFIEREAPHYNLTTPEGQEALLQALKPLLMSKA